MASSLRNGNKDSPPPLGEGVVKVVVVGEPGCGKTRFIHSHYDDNFPGEIYSHNGVRVYPCAFWVDNQFGRVKIFEIPGHPGFFLEQRTPHYEDADVIVFMYAIDDPGSLQMLVAKWIPEVVTDIIIGSLPVIFIGTKRDLRDDQKVIDRLAQQNQSPVTFQQASEVLSNVPVRVTIMECSLSVTASVRRVFNAIFRLIPRNEVLSDESDDD